MHILEVQNIVTNYLEVFPDETEKLQELQNRLTLDEKFNHRKSFSGHGTGAAIVFSPDKTEILLIHHKFLDRWLQPGGHWDPEDPDPWTVAEREAIEETGVRIARIVPLIPEKPEVPIDIGSHFIPANPKKDEPAHFHHDFRYVFIASDKELAHQEKEVFACRWIPLNDTATIEPEIRALIDKVQAKKLI